MRLEPQILRTLADHLRRCATLTDDMPTVNKLFELIHWCEIRATELEAQQRTQEQQT